MCEEDELGCHMSGWMTQSTGVLDMKVIGSVTTPENVIEVHKVIFAHYHLSVSVDHCTMCVLFESSVRIKQFQLRCNKKLFDALPVPQCVAERKLQLLESTNMSKESKDRLRYPTY